jgi:hypothetical protein
MKQHAGLGGGRSLSSGRLETPSKVGSFISLSLLHMSLCSPSSLAPCATFAWKSLVLVTYPIVYHAVRFLLVLLWKPFLSTYPAFFSGHVLCLSCCNQILAITTSHLVPACPFCRGPFSHGTVRLIRIDSNRVTPPAQVHHQRKSKGVCPTIFSLFILFLFYYFPHHIHARPLTFLNIEHHRS